MSEDFPEFKSSLEAAVKADTETNRDAVEPVDSPVIRKSTDVLLDIEEKVDLIMKMIQNMNHNYLVMMDRLNRLAAPGPSAPENAFKGQPGASTGPKTIPPPGRIVPGGAIPGMGSPEPVRLAENAIQIEQDPKGVRRTSRPEAIEKNRDSKITVAIHQQVMDESEKIIYMAEVELTNESNELVLKTRTTASGRWQASVKPGKYNLSILKRANSSRKQMGIKKTITVPPDATPYELEAVKLQEIK